MEKQLPSIPAKRYFTIGEVAVLCDVKPHVLRYWEQEFTQLRPVKRRGNRRYYQHHEVLMIRRIRELLYERGFTISGARNQLQTLPRGHAMVEALADDAAFGLNGMDGTVLEDGHLGHSAEPVTWQQAAIELQEIRRILSGEPEN
ncbi:MerR family transcriptional regulator [Comamonas odontotermitis]|uniref:MerR family transcriptional regulator n=1 Tax=Comamonas odontotermitis TaxID=379895 RepID=UPI003751C6A4